MLSACSQHEIRGLQEAKQSLIPMATSSLHNVIHAKILNVVQKERVFKITVSSQSGS